MENRREQKTGILGTGATSGSAPEEDKEAIKETGMNSNKTFMFPNKRTRSDTKKMHLKHKLRETAKEINIVPGLHSTLISIPKLADANYATVFKKEKATIYDATTTSISATLPPVLEAHQCKLTGLWKLNLEPDEDETTKANDTHQPKETLNVIFDLPSTRQSLLWYHAAAGFPTKETFIDAVRAGNYASWPGLTTNMINRHFPDSTETAKEHLKGQRQGIRSIKQKAPDKFVKLATTIVKLEQDNSPPAPIARHCNIFICIEDLPETIHTNQTGGSPYTPQQGNRYIMTAIHLNGNYIFIKAMKNRTQEEMIEAYQRIINRMRAAGLGLKKHILHNEASKAFKELIRENGLEYELVPPGNHRRNQAECAILTFKAHFIAILAGVDSKFPLSLWCHLLKPTELTLNLLRQFKVSPKISAFAHVHGPHNYMKKPFVPLGCAIQAHVKPNDRRTWDA
jgi:hypothetical protein